MRKQDRSLPASVLSVLSDSHEKFSYRITPRTRGAEKQKDVQKKVYPTYMGSGIMTMSQKPTEKDYPRVHGEK